MNFIYLFSYHTRRLACIFTDIVWHLSICRAVFIFLDDILIKTIENQRETLTMLEEILERKEY